MIIGIRAHDLPNAPFNNIQEMIDVIKQFDIDALQLVYKKAFNNFNMDPNFLLKLADELKNNEINVSMIGAYFNMIHPDEEKRTAGIEYFKWCIETASLFDCDIVGSETGSKNGDKWTYNEYNHTKEAFDIVVNTVKELNKYGSLFKCRPIIEGAYAHTIYKPELLNELIKLTDINDVTVDIYNYLNINNYKEANKIFDKCIELFKDKIKIIHVKDYNVIDNTLSQCSIGKGIMDWKYMIPLIKKHCPKAALILEGVTGDTNIKESILYVKELINE